MDNLCSSVARMSETGILPREPPQAEEPGSLGSQEAVTPWDQHPDATPWDQYPGATPWDQHQGATTWEQQPGDGDGEFPEDWTMGEMEDNEEDDTL